LERTGKINYEANVNCTTYNANGNHLQSADKKKKEMEIAPMRSGYKKLRKDEVFL
jgi:hypothetical protein